MSYFHVIAKLAESKDLVCLFQDLTLDDLRLKFLQPYELGRDFMSGTDVIASKEIRSIRIIETLRDNSTEREEIKRISRAKIDEINRASESAYFISIGKGWVPEDIAEAGEDVTSVYIKGAPGYLSFSSKSARVALVSDKEWHEHSLFKAAIALIVAVIGGGLIYAFGWN